MLTLCQVRKGHEIWFQKRSQLWYMYMSRKKYWREIHQDLHSFKLWDYGGFLFSFFYFPVYKKYFRMRICYPHRKKNEHYPSTPKTSGAGHGVGVQGLSGCKLRNKAEGALSPVSRSRGKLLEAGCSRNIWDQATERCLFCRWGMAQWELVRSALPLISTISFFYIYQAPLTFLAFLWVLTRAICNPRNIWSDRDNCRWGNWAIESFTRAWKRPTNDIILPTSGFHFNNIKLLKIVFPKICREEIK